MSSQAGSETIAQLERSKAAARALRHAPAAMKNAVLEAVAKGLAARQDEILKANAADLAGLKSDATEAFRDRLTLNPQRLSQMQVSLRQVATLPDPVGEVLEERVLPNGVRTRRVRAPLGVILMIFESRPNVAVEAFSLAFKSGNVILLRGGKESMATTAVLYSIIRESLQANELPAEAVWGITNPDRELVTDLLSQRAFIDVVVPRGGDALIEFVVKNSLIPIIKNDRGLCHVYVHEEADLKMAEEIVWNAKTQRPGVCNAMETLLVHQAVAKEFLPKLHERLSQKNVKWLACPKTLSILGGRTSVEAAPSTAFDTEHLDLIMNSRVVDSFEQAVQHIEKHGSRHSEAIVTRSHHAAKEFQNEVDAAAVYWNASTRFTDGFELGLGGELGISTQKLHVRGPVGLRELTSTRWIIEGEGQVRA